MAFTEITSLDADTTIALGGINKQTGKANPKSAEGYYLGTRQVDGKRGKSNLHFLQTPKGNLGVWGKTDLDRKLASVKPGTMVRLSHTGMQETPKGDMYKFKVEVDASNTIEVATLSAGSSTAGDDESYSDEDSADVDLDVSDDSYDYDAEEAAQQAALAAAERKAKMQSILNKGKNK